MVLMLKTETAISIAIRHYTNSIYTNIKKVDEESSKLNYKYLNEMIAPFNSEIATIQNTLVALNNVVGEKGAKYVEQKLIEIDAHIKETCVNLITKIQIKQGELKLFASKFDDLLSAILALAKRDVTTFIKLSMDKKSEKINALNDGIPTVSEISSVLRLPELHSGDLYEEAKDEAVYQARRNYDKYNKNTDTLEFIEAYIYPSISELTLDIMKSAVKKVIVQNEDGEVFLNSKLPLVNSNFWKRNLGKLARELQPMLDEFVEEE